MRRTLLAVLMVLAPVAVMAGDSIEWHQGDVESAFERAEQEDKPLFLYWGAVWCPPCAQVKKTIFSQREFIEKTKLFIPVYLDGDTESAQIWADRLDISGYPTMLVLSPQGREVLRLPTGLQIEAFNNVLDDALAQMVPIGEVLDNALTAHDPGRVPDQTYRLLAYHSWSQDRKLDLSPEDKEYRFRLLAERVPQELGPERARLYLLWVDSALDLGRQDAKEGKPFRLPKAQRKELDLRLHEILDDSELTLATLEYVSYMAGQLIEAAHPKDSRARRKLVDRWLDTTKWVENNESLSVDERLSVLIAALSINSLQNGDEGELDPDLVDRVSRRVEWTDKAADDTYTRQAALSTAGYLLRKVGRKDEARELYLAEVEKSDSPYYFMSSLARLAREAGDTEEAVSWMARAYDSAEGHATRFQWGTSYLVGLMDLTPEDAATIQAESERVLVELLGFADAFAGRNGVRIGRLERAYAEWNADDAHDSEISAVRDSLAPSCSNLSTEAAEGDQSQRSRCEEFFAQLGDS